MKELFELYKRNFPLIVRDDDTVLRILGKNDNKVLEKRNEQGQLVGASVINKNAILMLCVDKEYRKQGIGTELLAMSEAMIGNDGYREIVVGVGFDYLMPGVPTSKRYCESVNEELYQDADTAASDFFEKRGYKHSWDCNCFDMRFWLKEFQGDGHTVGDTIDGITYRWATLADLEEICNCTDAACEEFTKYYRDKALYQEDDWQRVLIAAKQGEVVGTLIVGLEAGNLGSVGCTAVKPAYRGRHIAVHLVLLGTKYLKDSGLQEAYLSYTYTGLDRLYGYAGYKICLYYMMAKKELTEETV